MEDKGVPCRKPPKERGATVVTTVKDDITMDESASVSNPAVMEIIEPDDDCKDNNNVNIDYIILGEENEWLKKENELLKQQLEAAQDKVLIDRLSSGIKSEIELSDATCNHYTGFPTNERLSAVYDFLNPGINGENVIVYDNQVNERFSGGARRAMLPFTC